MKAIAISKPEKAIINAKGNKPKMKNRIPLVIIFDVEINYFYMIQLFATLQFKGKKSNVCIARLFTTSIILQTDENPDNSDKVSKNVNTEWYDKNESSTEYKGKGKQIAKYDSESDIVKQDKGKGKEIAKYDNESEIMEQDTLPSNRSDIHDSSQLLGIMQETIDVKLEEIEYIKKDIENLEISEDINKKTQLEEKLRNLENSLKDNQELVHRLLNQSQDNKITSHSQSTFIGGKDNSPQPGPSKESNQKKQSALDYVIELEQSEMPWPGDDLD